MWIRSMTMALLSVVVAWPAAAQNAVNDWSGKAQHVITAGRPPASSEYLLALVHAAMYDAVVAIEGRYQPFRVRVTVHQPASAEAAAAAAAYHILRQRVPSAEPALTTDYAAYVSTLPAGPSREQGLEVGVAVAKQWLARRANDRFDANVPYHPPPSGPGVWEPTVAASPVDVKMAQVQPYVMRSADEFRPRGPRPLPSRVYGRALDEVYHVGRIDSITRTAEQLEVARFWAEHTGVQWNRNLRQLAAAAQLDLVHTARLLAMVHVASADAVVGCFEAKYSFLLWRPVHAIQRADEDDNRWTAADPTWTALLNVNHPEYPSAHSCWTQAATDTLTHFFGTDRADFELDSAITGSSRRYARFSEVAEEVQDARVWAGIHFRFSTEDGATIGRNVARLVTRHHFKPVRR